MPSSSILFFWWVLSLVARCAQSVRKVFFVLCTTLCATRKFARPLGNTVNFSMFFWGYQNKITQLVVLRVAVFMVYVYTFGRSSKNTVLVLPFVWFSNFYAYIHTTITCFMQTFAPHRKLNSDLRYNALFGCFDFICHCFICAGWATRSVVVGIAVNAFFPQNRGSAKWTWFSKKSFHGGIIYQA